MLVTGFEEAHGPDGFGLRFFDRGIVKLENQSAIQANDMIVMLGLGSFIEGDTGTALQRFLEKPGLAQGLHVPIDRGRTDFGMAFPDFANQLLDFKMTVV